MAPPPYSLGTFMPMRPDGAAFTNASRGRSSFSSQAGGVRDDLGAGEVADGFQETLFTLGQAEFGVGEEGGVLHGGWLSGKPGVLFGDVGHRPAQLHRNAGSGFLAEAEIEQFNED